MTLHVKVLYAPSRTELCWGLCVKARERKNFKGSLTARDDREASGVLSVHSGGNRTFRNTTNVRWWD